MSDAWTAAEAEYDAAHPPTKDDKPPATGRNVKVSPVAEAPREHAADQATAAGSVAEAVSSVPRVVVRPVATMAESRHTADHSAAPTATAAVSAVPTATADAAANGVIPAATSATTGTTDNVDIDNGAAASGSPSSNAVHEEDSAAAASASPHTAHSDTALTTGKNEKVSEDEEEDEEEGDIIWV